MIKKKKSSISSVNSVKDEKQNKIKTKKEKATYNPKIRIKIRSYDHRIIDTATKTIIEAIERSNAKVIGPIFLPTEKKKYTVLRSSFVHKDAREQFETRIHKRLIDVTNFTGKTTETLSNLHLPAGVDIEIKM